jgi:hypothetical protein
MSRKDAQTGAAFLRATLESVGIPAYMHAVLNPVFSVQQPIPSNHKRIQLYNFLTQ